MKTLFLARRLLIICSPMICAGLIVDAAALERPISSNDVSVQIFPQPSSSINSDTDYFKSGSGLLLAQASAECKSCGEVTAVRSIEVSGKATGAGAGVGAVVGGILGSAVGSGTTRSLATVAGAVGGGYAGNEIEKRSRSNTQYEVLVRMQSGKTRSFKFDEKPHWEVGDLVKVVNGTLTERDE